MTTEVDICNLALSAMGTRSTIAPLDASGFIAQVTESSPEAVQCKLWFPTVRDSMLRKHLWNFARTVYNLVQLRALPGTPENTASVVNHLFVPETYPSPPWRYEYQYQPDVIRIRYIWPQGQPVPPASFDQYYSQTNRPVPFEVYQRSGVKVVGTNERNAIVVYTRRISDPNLWDSDFTLALISELAARLAIPLSGDLKLMQLNKQVAINDFTEARVTDGNEGLTEQVHPMADWISARDD